MLFVTEFIWNRHVLQQSGVSKWSEFIYHCICIYLFNFHV